MPVVPEYLTTVEAAAYLGISRQVLQSARWRGDGSGPEFIKLKRLVRYRRSALDAFMVANAMTGREPVGEATARREARLSPAS